MAFPFLAMAGVGAGLGLIGGIGKMFGARKANRELEKLLKQNPQYQVNPIAKQRLGLAQSLLNARMPGAAAMERNIYANQANALGQINRNATDASQALALAAGAQGQTNQALGQLGLQESQDYYNRLGNLTGAQQGMIAEGDKQYQDQVRRFQDMVSIRGAQAANRANAWQGLSNLGFGMMNMGLAGAGGMGGTGSMMNSGGYYYPSAGLAASTNFSTTPLYNTPNTGAIPLPPIKTTWP